MSRSGLLPSFLSLTWRDRGTPYGSMIGGSVLGFITIIVGWSFASDIVAFADIVFAMCLFGAFVTYLFQLTAYIILKIQFPQLKREYHSPLGLFGAFLGYIVFLLCLIGALGFQDYIWQPLLGILLWFAVAIIYYIFVARHTITMLPEEQFAMFVVYVIKFNRGQKKTSRQSARITPGERASLKKDNSVSRSSRSLKSPTQQQRRIELELAHSQEEKSELSDTSPSKKDGVEA